MGAAAVHDPSSIGLTTTHGLWRVNATLGNSTQPIEFQWDTGSSVLWVAKSNAICCSTAGTQNPCPADSESCAAYGKAGAIPDGKLLLKDFKQDYGVGAITGDIYETQVTIGGMSIKAAAVFASEVFQPLAFFRTGSPGMQGIMGVGTPTTQHGERNVVTALLFEGVLKKPLFSFAFASPGADRGHVVLGELDNSSFRGDLHWLETVVNYNGYWLFRSEEISIGPSPSTKGGLAIVDSGAAFIIVNSSSAYKAWLGKLQEGVGDGLHMVAVSATVKVPVIPCSALPLVPTVEVAIAGARFALDGKDLSKDYSAYKSILPDSPELPEGMCLLAVSSFPLPGGADFLLGDPWLEKVYTAFEVNLTGPSRLGFALRAF